MAPNGGRTKEVTSGSTIRPTRSSAATIYSANRCFFALAILSAVQLLLPPPIGGNIFVHCQDFEDLNNRQIGANNLPTPQFQPLSRQSQLAPLQPPAPQQHFGIVNGPLASSVSSAPNQPTVSVASSATSSSSSSSLSSSPSSSSSTGNNSRPQAQRPLLSNRFTPNVQASEPIRGQPQQQSPSNIEQIMKNALARTARLETLEARQDTLATAPVPEVPQSRSGQEQPASAPRGDKVAESSETRSASEAGQTGQEGDEGDKQTTAPQTTTTSGHETVYSDQRFANLFARRGTAKRSRIQPHEQMKAKPTLPSFIKSLPDPKQFSAAASAVQERPATPAGANFASARLQQQPGRLNGNQKSKATAAPTNNGNNSNNNKRINSGAKPTPGPKSSNVRATSSTTTRPLSNNPFHRQQSAASNDPANVIAMARKRLLANNALESASKLKHQQQQQQQKQQAQQ